MRALVFLSVLAAAAPAHADSATTRAPSAQETNSFIVYFRARYPGSAAKPRFDIRRGPANRGWDVGVLVDAPPVRGVGKLCRMNQTRFDYRHGSWSEAVPATQFAWLDAGPCAVPARPVLLAQRMPDLDVTALLEQQAALLLRARLLFSGNTSCASLRAYTFHLAALDVAPAVGPEEMPVLEFHSERESVARVWIRRRGAEMTPWSVACEDHDRAPG